MDEVIKIAILGKNLINKIDIINEIKKKYINQFIVPMDVLNMPESMAYEEYWRNFEAVFFLGNASEDKGLILNWLGHNHFRFIDVNLADKVIIDRLSQELDCIINNIELEKKLLIKMPNFKELSDNYPVYKTHIEQTYLNCPKGTHRIRKRTSNGVTEYIETIKIRLTNSKCVECENIIDKSMYYTLMKEKDNTKSTIVKDRYFILFEGNRFELDVYDFWTKQATVELEIPNENYKFNLPKGIELIKDVSNDYMYKNKYLAGLSYEDSKTKVF